jgi:transcriptional regulator with PAS, ATPase and Fis domain
MDRLYPDMSLIGRSEAFGQIQSLIDKVKDLNAPVSISGESGTGKELIARAIHFRGVRRHGQFVAVNCGAIPEHLLESELFGYARGAFTGALRDKTGLIEEADAGTFFLDEIGDLSLQLQAKLLRLIQEKEIRRIGENRTRPVDVRFISATNKDIEKEVESGRFREDLYYRLRIITIDIPPLRERRDDLVLLMDYFIEKYSREIRNDRVFFSPRVRELFFHYPWPGNVRELQNEIQRCIILCGEEKLVREEHLSPKLNPGGQAAAGSPFNFFEAKADFVRRFLNQALLRTNFNKARAAEEIGLSRQGLFKLLKKYKIEVSADSKN